MKRLLALLVVLGCSKEPTSTNSPTTTSTGPGTPPPCGALGGSCSSEGTLCSPAPIGSGWAHVLHCHNGKWTEVEVAPLPPPSASPHP